MRKKALIQLLLVTAISCIIPTRFAQAQQVSLSDTEIQKLKQWITQDSMVARQYENWVNLSRQALQEAPNPITKIQSQGLLEGNPVKTASLKAVHDGDKVYALGLMYRLTKNSKYLAKAGSYLQAWAQVNQSEGDPINDTKLEPMITGYDLVRKALPVLQQQVIDEWLKQIADAEIHSKYALSEKGTAVNNWNSHRVKIIALIACVLHSTQLVERSVTELQKQVAQNLNPDGTSIDFLERDAFHYHIYDLEPLTAAVLALKRYTNKNYFDTQSPQRASIKKSVDFMIPYMNGEKQHQEFVGSKVAFDRRRAENHEKGYAAGTHFEPLTAVNLFSLATALQPTYQRIVELATGKKGNSNWTLILSRLKQ